MFTRATLEEPSALVCRAPQSVETNPTSSTPAERRPRNDPGRIDRFCMRNTSVAHNVHSFRQGRRPSFPSVIWTLVGLWTRLARPGSQPCSVTCPGGPIPFCSERHVDGKCEQPGLVPGSFLIGKPKSKASGAPGEHRNVHPQARADRNAEVSRARRAPCPCPRKRPWTGCS